MDTAYLPGTVRSRLLNLMKECKVTQVELATRIGSSESSFSRFITGKTDKISPEQIIRIARVFNVSTDFLLGIVDIPDRKNYEIAELGLSVQAARNLYTGKVNADVVNRLLESVRFAEVTYMIEQYLNDSMAKGFAAQNQLFTSLSAMLRGTVKTDAAVQAARDTNRMKVPIYQADQTTIQNQFMAAVREVKQEVGNDIAASRDLSKEVTQKMFAELTKGQDTPQPSITPEQLAHAVTDSIAGMDGVDQDALGKLGLALEEFMQRTLEHAQEKQDAEQEQ